MEKILIPDKIISILKKDPLQNANILNFIEGNTIIDFKLDGNSFFVKGISDREWIYFSCSNEKELLNLLENLPDNNLNFAVIEDWQIPIIQKIFNIEIELTTMKYCLPYNVEMVPAKSLEISPLPVEYAEYIYQNSIYKEFTSIEYIRERLISGISCGISRDKKLIAWAITHDDGAIGFLHVLDEYRGLGYAADVMKFMINRVKAKNSIPFAQIEEHNFPSINLVKKLGFVEYKRVHWISAKLKTNFA